MSIRARDSVTLTAEHLRGGQLTTPSICLDKQEIRWIRVANPHEETAPRETDRTSTLNRRVVGAASRSKSRTSGSGPLHCDQLFLMSSVTYSACRTNMVTARVNRTATGSGSELSCGMMSPRWKSTGFSFKSTRRSFFGRDAESGLPGWTKTVRMRPLGVDRGQHGATASVPASCEWPRCRSAEIVANLYTPILGEVR